MFLKSREDGKEFVVKGCHCTVTACSLAEWLHDDVVNYMNGHFGRLLRKELVHFLSRPELQLNRVDSSGSKGASVHSSQGGPWNVKTPVSWMQRST